VRVKAKVGGVTKETSVTVTKSLFISSGGRLSVTRAKAVQNKEAHLASRSALHVRSYAIEDVGSLKDVEKLIET
jgi:hypothetical protein